MTSWLGIEVDEDQVVMSHSPLKMFRDYHDKHVLVIGQGPVDDIARALGFRKVTTIQQLRHAFPTLDNVDHKRRRGNSPTSTAAVTAAVESCCPRAHDWHEYVACKTCPQCKCVLPRIVVSNLLTVLTY